MASQKEYFPSFPLITPMLEQYNEFYNSGVNRYTLKDKDITRVSFFPYWRSCRNSKDFRLGDLVLAKVKGFPAWPAKVRYSQFQFFGLFTISFIILLGCEFMILQF
ncbi:Tudor/PWWP/MBT domain-containing protein [Trifolium repens]|nr:Tudor/PWWP/MBT domain-containing protein [Trifolium repens]